MTNNRLGTVNVGAFTCRTTLADWNWLTRERSRMETEFKEEKADVRPYCHSIAFYNRA
jgi:hypothetical protein